MLQPDIPTNTPTRVVVAEGDEKRRAHLCRQLSPAAGFAAYGAESWDKLKGLLGESVFDVVVVGGDVGGIADTEINEKVTLFCQDRPSTILLGGDSSRAAVRAFRCGFADYLITEAAGGRELKSAVLRAAGIARERRQRRQYVAELEKLAQCDGVTGMANRPFLHDRLDQLVRIGRQRHLQFAVIAVRLNDLDAVRASFGCKVADQALYAFARRLKNASRSSDTLGRFEADTFLFLVDREVSPRNIAVTCQRLVETATFVMNSDNLGLSLTASVGAAVYPSDGTTIVDLLAAVENALGSGASADTPAKGDGVAHLRANGAAASHGEAELIVDGEEQASDAGPGDEPYSVQLVERDADRRIEHRHRALKGGLLVLENGMGAVNCLVRDISSTGARVSVDGLLNLPESAELVLIESRKKVRVEPRWQKGNELGLMFVD